MPKQKTRYAECGPGWAKLYTPLYEACEALNVDVTQVKEKFGGLRFYTGFRPEWLADLIHLVESHSHHVCEKCGEDGHTQSFGGWYATLCPQHTRERNNAQADSA